MAITGLYKDFLILLVLIVVHEFGHIIPSIIFNWNIEKIAIYPFGGCVKFNEKINKPIKEEFLILAGGPFLQTCFFLFITICFKNIVSIRNLLILKEYHLSLLIFNFLPIYPLDGGKLVNLITNYFMPYKKGNKLVILISFILIILIIFLNKELNFILMISLLLGDLLIYFKRQDYLYNKFLLERYLNPKSYKKLKIIKNKDNMYRERRHILKKDNKYITEHDYLINRYKR